MAALATLVLSSGLAQAQSGGVKLMVGFPAGGGTDAIDRIAEVVSKVVAMPDVRDKLTAMGLTVGYMPPAHLASREQAYAQIWTKIIKASGFQAQ